MTELLTESFCERCGTRYTFEAAAPKRRLRGLRTLGSGIRTFVLSNDVSLDEAMAAARSEAEREASTHQLDAFHRTFSFCMSCRQYTCSSCWNDIEGRCLTCAPDPSRDALAAPFALPAVELPPPTLMALETAAVAEPEAPAFPEAELLAARLGFAEPEPVADVEPVAAPEPEVEAELEAPVESEADLEAQVEAEAEPEVTPEPALSIETETAPEPVERTARRAAGRTNALLARFRPGQSLDEAIAAYEAGLEPQPAPEPEPEPVAAAPEPQPEPEPEPVAAAPEPQPEPEPVRTDVVEQPVWPAPQPVPPAPAPEAPPQWPTGPRWPTAIPARAPAPSDPEPVGDPLAAVLAGRATGDLWATLSADIVRPSPTAASMPVVHQCTSCGLTLSATARFCRRCGTRQEG